MTMIETVTAGVLSRLRAGLAVGGAPGEAELIAMVGAAAVETGRVLGAADVLAVTARVRAELWGLGPLQPLLDQPGVTDVLVNGPGEVWTDTGAGLTRVPVTFAGEEDLRALAVRLAVAGGRRLDEASPW